MLRRKNFLEVRLSSGIVYDVRGKGRYRRTNWQLAESSLGMLVFRGAQILGARPSGQLNF